MTIALSTFDRTECTLAISQSTFKTSSLLAFIICAITYKIMSSCDAKK